MIRITIVDDSVESVENIERIIFFEPDIEVVGTANDGEAGLQLVRETKPDVALFDINMPGMDGLTAAEAITKANIGTQVIIISVQDDREYVRRAMQAGARDYILKPFEIDEIAKKIRQVYTLAKGQPTIAPEAEKKELGRLLTVFSPRGGCGCTTLAVNLAIALRMLTKRKVVIVDAALQFGDVAVMLNLQGQHTIADLARQTEEVDASFASEITVAHQSGVRALLSPFSPEQAELVHSDAMHHILVALQQEFDYVVVDGGHVLNEVFLAALDETEELLLVVTPDIPAIKSDRLMLNTLDALKFSVDKRLLVINQSGRRCGVKVDDIERSLGLKAAAKLPYDDVGPLLAANQGRPIILMDQDAPICTAIFNLAQKLAGEQVKQIADTASKPQTKGLFALWQKN